MNVQYMSRDYNWRSLYSAEPVHHVLGQEGAPQVCDAMPALVLDRSLRPVRPEAAVRVLRKTCKRDVDESRYL